MVDPELKDNYRRLKAERGVTWQQLADQTVGPLDRSLAAWMREQAASEDSSSAGADVARSEPPRQRTRTRHEVT